ncbi:MAG: hypothetical protein KBS59_06490, partial [Clostridiales bacterium]|nr:hypothetical protein [Clostridiales bacterium]
MNKKDETKRRFLLWKGRYESAKVCWQSQLRRFDECEELYRGTHRIEQMTETNLHAPKKTRHCWNIVAENIESEVDSTIPYPKVTARRKENEDLALKIERMLRNEIDRINIEQINDIQERTVPVCGGAFYASEWDETKQDHNRRGDNELKAIHPKQFVPQPGVYTDVDDMEYFFLRLPTTKGYIMRRYGVDLKDVSEEEPDARGENEAQENDMVTLVTAFYKNNENGIGKMSWVGDVVLEDFENYQKRRMRRCVKCGATEIAAGAILNEPTTDGTIPEGETRKRKKDECPYCGASKWEETETDTKKLNIPMMIAGRMIGGANPVLDEMGNVTLEAVAEVPYYKPDIFPIVMQKNIWVFGQLMGESDALKCRDQQNTLNRMEQKIIDRICKAGAKITLPANTQICVDENDNEVIRIENPADKAMIDVYEFSGNLSSEMSYLSQVYEESRRTLGITDAFQGRRDTTAKSGAAKQFAAAQSAGRLESKRRLKQMAYQKIYERMFKNRLAYADEPRPITYIGEDGDV